MVLLALVKVFVALAMWFVSLFPSGQPHHLTSLIAAFKDMGFLGLVLPFGAIGSAVGIAVGIVTVTWLISALIWAWKLVKW